MKKKIEFDKTLPSLISGMFAAIDALRKVRNDIKKVEESKRLSPEELATLSKRVKAAWSLITTGLEDIRK